jgi:hypothetical protein
MLTIKSIERDNASKQNSQSIINAATLIQDPKFTNVSAKVQIYSHQKKALKNTINTRRLVVKKIEPVRPISLPYLANPRKFNKGNNTIKIGETVIAVPAKVTFQ